MEQHFLKCKSSRNHTEIMYKDVLKLPIKIKKGNYDFIKEKVMNSSHLIIMCLVIFPQLLFIVLTL